MMMSDNALWVIHYYYIVGAPGKGDFYDTCININSFIFYILCFILKTDGWKIKQLTILSGFILDFSILHIYLIDAYWIQLFYTHIIMIMCKYNKF